MVRPAHRSRSMARTKKRLPGGANVVHYVRRKPKVAHCSNCGNRLSGVPRARSTRFRTKYSKVQRRPERPYGGQICPRCLKAKIQAAVQRLPP